MRSLRLPSEPTVRQVNAILDRIERELRAHGARVTRPHAGTLRFDMPRPWRNGAMGIVAAITSGRTTVSAGAGGPRRVRYELRFTTLLALTGVASLALLAIGWRWPRAELLVALLSLWVVLYGVPYAAATARFQRLLTAAVREVLERRSASRTPSVEVPALPVDGPTPGGPAAPPANPSPLERPLER